MWSHWIDIKILKHVHLETDDPVQLGHKYNVAVPVTMGILYYSHLGHYLLCLGKRYSWLHTTTLEQYEVLCGLFAKAEEKTSKPLACSLANSTPGMVKKKSSSGVWCFWALRSQLTSPHLSLHHHCRQSNRDHLSPLLETEVVNLPKGKSKWKNPKDLWNCK